MRLSLLATVLAAAVLASAPVLAQDKSLASTIGVYAFPKDGQDDAQQSKDQSDCYDWAVDNTGNDPFELAKEADSNLQESEAMQQQAQQVGRGAGARGAVGGAAAGAIIGEIASDDAGEGAAWGAALGAVHKRREARREQAAAQQEADAATVAGQVEPAAKLDDFKKAFSACLEAKDYLVKY